MGNIFELRMNNLVQIIANYRKDELPFLIDVSHVKKWISQFDSSAQSVVLEETIHILSNWYFGHAKLVSFMREIVEYIRLAYTDFRNVTFWNGQEVGQSQRKLLSLLPEAYPGKTVNIDTVPRKHIVYIDDGLYTGSRIRKDIENVLSASSEVETLDIFFAIAYSNGFEYAKNILKQKGDEFGVAISLHRFKELNNIKQTEYADGSESYYSDIGVLWPSSRVSNEKPVKQYLKYMEDCGRTMRLKYKTEGHQYSQSIFTSCNNREIVEREFLIKGLSILPECSIDKGLYPLGYDINPSFGFGSFCANDFNISNTCPVVLWWDADSNWYPLLPRRINSKADFQGITAWEENS